MEESQHQSTHSCRRSPRPPFPREIFASAVIITSTTNTEFDYEPSIVFSFVLASVAGCEAVTEKATNVSQAFIAQYPDLQKPINLVFFPGYKVMIDGKATPIIGEDACPPPDGVMAKLFGPTPDEDSKECVEVSPTATEVHVKFPDVAADGSLKKEEWSVLRDGGRVALRRPNGDFVIPEKH